MTRVAPKLVMLLAAAVVAAWTYPAQAQFEALRRLTGSADPVKQIVYFKIKGALTETPANIPPLFGSEPPASLKSMIERFKKARTDNNVLAVVVDLQHAELGLAQLQEIHAELRKFAAVDKPVFIHADSLSTLTYAASTGASQLSMVPTGELWLLGLYGATPYLRGTLDKIGCEPDIETMGDYKTAGEPLMRKEPSPEQKAMTDWLLDSLYTGLVNVIAEGRAMPPEKVRALIDKGPYTAKEALAAGLIDAVQHRQEFVSSIKNRYGTDVKIVSDYGEEDPFKMPSDNPFAVFEMLMKLLNPQPRTYTEPSVAIVFVEGTIQTGSAEPSPFGPTAGAFSTTIRKALDKAANDGSVRAIVLRVDSPGGSALASEIILDATKRVAKKKPLVVSMGNVAASGGYYVSCGAKTVFADPDTITASIGVLGGKIVTTGMWNKLGVNWYESQRGDMAGLFSTSEKFTDKERQKIRDYMQEVYTTFKNHVTAARGEKLKKPIDEIAAGRVYTGAQALDLGLIDKLGGLDDAIKFAASEALLGEYDIRVIPEPPSLLDLFVPRDKEDDIVRAAAPGLRLTNQPEIRTLLFLIAEVDPLRFRAMLRMLQRVELLHRESVLTVMPMEYVIR